MLEDPGHDPGELAQALRTAYGLTATAFTFLPSHDSAAAAYRVTTPDAPVFLKVHEGPIRSPAALEVPRLLTDAGVPNLVPPVRALDGKLSAPMGARTMVVQPWIDGRPAVDVGLTRTQWRAFGTTLRAVHDVPTDGFGLPADPFALPSAPLVSAVLERLPGERRAGAPGRLVEVLARHEGTLRHMIERATALAAHARSQSWSPVVCHGDVHAGNVLATEDGGIAIVDWDGPILAPRERDLLFVIGSRIARTVTPQEEAAFFEGYGAVAVDADLMRLFRYERILEDVSEVAADLLDRGMPEASAERWIGLVDGFFGSGGIAETVEIVDLSRVPAR